MPEQYAYMVMSRCMMDLEFWINTKSGYCGNCTPNHLFFGSTIEEHVHYSLTHYKTLPVKPKWLSTKKLHRLASKAIKLGKKYHDESYIV